MNKLVSNLLNRIFQNFEMNFESLSDMIFFEISQFAMSNRLSSVSAQLRAVHVNFSKIIVTFLNALQVTINAVFMSLESAEMKFIANVLNETFSLIDTSSS
jgi:hypothetical protein